MGLTIFDCCDCCDAVMSVDEREMGERFGQSLCDDCAADYAAAQRYDADMAHTDNLARIYAMIADCPAGRDGGERRA